jgi:hypothetical protein
MKKLFLLLLIVPDFAFTQEEKSSVKYYYLFYQIDDHFINSFTENFGFYHLAAIAGSYGMIETGFDWEAHEFARKNQWMARTGFVSVEAGHLIPMVVPAGLFLYGELWNDNDFIVSSLALGQSIILSYIIVSGLKAVTGRRGPEILDEEDTPVKDYSQDFKWSFFERGVFDG